MTNPLKTVLYIGVTNNLLRRVLEHKKHFNEKSFTSKYNVTKLIYFEMFETMYDAIVREKQLKRWHRKWKEGLIFKMNNMWRDLSLDWEEMKSGMDLIERS
jgi:putative endonuclease